MRKLKDDLLQERIKMPRSRWTKKLADINYFKNEVGNLAVEFALNDRARSLVKVRTPRVPKVDLNPGQPRDSMHVRSRP